jgi:hypothetical protein
VDAQRRAAAATAAAAAAGGGSGGGSGGGGGGGLVGRMMQFARANRMLMALTVLRVALVANALLFILPVFGGGEHTSHQTVHVQQ